MTTEADRLLAAGVPLRGVDGEVRLRFTMLALKRCEDTYGSLGGVLDEMRWLNAQLLDGFPEPVAARTLTLVQTVADRPVDDLAETPTACLDALNAAWFEAFGGSEDDEGKAAGETGAPRGPGASSGASPESTSA